MSESFEKELPEESEAPSLNNFHMYLPSNVQRSIYSKNPEKAHLMETIDRLLQTEFSEIHLPEIMEIDAKKDQLIKAGMKIYSTGGSEAELARLDQEDKALGKKKYDILLPLFNRLLELGFDKRTLLG